MRLRQCSRVLGALGMLLSLHVACRRGTSCCFACFQAVLCHCHEKCCLLPLKGSQPLVCKYVHACLWPLSTRPAASPTRFCACPHPSTSFWRVQEAGSRSAAAVRSAPGVLGDKMWSAVEYVLDSLRGAAGYATGTARAAANAPRQALESAAAQFDEGFHRSDGNPNPGEGAGARGGDHAHRTYADAVKAGEIGSGQPGGREALEQGKVPEQGGGGRTGGSSVLGKAGEAARHVQDTAEHLASKARSARTFTARQQRSG